MSKNSQHKCQPFYFLPLFLLGVLLTACVSSRDVVTPESALPLPPPETNVTAIPTLTAEPSPSMPVVSSTDISSHTVATFPDASQYGWAPVLDGLDRPLDLTNAGDNSGRIFILEQNGRLLAVTPGAQTGSVLLDIRDKISRQGNEQGLLGVAFSPNFAQDRRFYLNYTDLKGNSVISRFRLEQGATQVERSSEQVLLRIEQPYANHNGGGMAFGKDGYLYIGLGDGGSAGDPENRAQSLDTLLGKLLRIDVNGETYSIPPDNPFANGGGKAEIWAYGLRNPWRFSFDPLSGDLYIGDVGQNKIEEIDYLPAGAPGGVNFGWDYREGSRPYEGQPPAGAVLVDPVWEYTHAEGCSVTGGVVYRGTLLPEFNGIYLFGDYCSGTVWGLLHDAFGNWHAEALFSTGSQISSFGVDESGEVYILDHGTGKVLKLVRR